MLFGLLINHRLTARIKTKYLPPIKGEGNFSKDDYSGLQLNAGKDQRNFEDAALCRFSSL
jgi:hypothetical protein